MSAVVRQGFGLGLVVRARGEMPVAPNGASEEVAIWNCQNSATCDPQGVTRLPFESSGDLIPLIWNLVDFDFSPLFAILFRWPVTHYIPWSVTHFAPPPNPRVSALDRLRLPRV
jgi:hypothetical protein